LHCGVHIIIQCTWDDASHNLSETTAIVHSGSGVEIDGGLLCATRDFNFIANPILICIIQAIVRTIHPSESRKAAIHRRADGRGVIEIAGQWIHAPHTTLEITHVVVKAIT
jgi:hypothetical protein